MGSFLSVAPAGVGDGAVSQSFTRCRVRSVVVPFEQVLSPGTKCCRAYDRRTGPRDGENCPSNRAMRPPRRSVRGPPRGPPGLELLAGGVLADGAVVEADRQEEVVRLTQHRAGPDAQRLGDLVAVELRPHTGQLLLLGESVDAPLEVVVGLGEACCLARVARRAVRAR